MMKRRERKRFVCRQVDSTTHLDTHDRSSLYILSCILIYFTFLTSNDISSCKIIITMQLHINLIDICRLCRSIYDRCRYSIRDLHTCMRLIHRDAVSRYPSIYLNSPTTLHNSVQYILILYSSSSSSPSSSMRFQSNDREIYKWTCSYGS